MRIGNTDNPEALEKACKHFEAMGHHGLKPSQRLEETDEAILAAALKHAADLFNSSGQWRLPSQKTGPIKGYPGKVWRTWNLALYRRGYSGLPDLFSSVGLKKDGKEVPEAIEEAYRRLEATGHHGLVSARETGAQNVAEKTVVEGQAPVRQKRVMRKKAGSLSSPEV